MIRVVNVAFYFQKRPVCLIDSVDSGGNLLAADYLAAARSFLRGIISSPIVAMTATTAPNRNGAAGPYQSPQ